MYYSLSVKDKIDLVTMGKAAIAEAKRKIASKVNDIHYQKGYTKTLFDFGIEKVEKQVGGHKPIVTISKLSMPTLAPKEVRELSDEEKRIEDRIKKLKASGKKSSFKNLSDDKGAMRTLPRENVLIRYISISKLKPSHTGAISFLLLSDSRSGVRDLPRRP
jgi:hypothetical protein